MTPKLGTQIRHGILMHPNFMIALSFTITTK